MPFLPLETANFPHAALLKEKKGYITIKTA